jgi:hypothetical protein
LHQNLDSGCSRRYCRGYTRRCWCGRSRLLVCAPGTPNENKHEK